MKLRHADINQREEWEKKGYHLPVYDRESVKNKTIENPVWIHFGAGNIFRAFLAAAADKLLNEGMIDRGIIAAEGFDYEVIEKIYRPHDDYSLLVTLCADGSVRKRVVGSVVESLMLDSENEGEFNKLSDIFAKDSLQMATFTITEKGYLLVNGEGGFTDPVKKDFAAGPKRPVSYIGKIVSLLYARFLVGKKAIALVSMDNCSRNGEKLYQAVHTFAEKWEENGLAESGFVSYIEEKVSFPWTMIDKITPRPDESVRMLLQKDGLEGMEPVVTSKNTYAAAFVNAEECEYLVIEDNFPNGRPPLEKAGFLFTDRKTVEEAEKMKVSACLNPLHTTLAVFGCLLGYERIFEEMKDKDIRKLVELVGYQEGLRVAVDPGVLNPKEFIDTVMQVRILNPFLPDTPQRIATDTSQKLAVRFGETIKAYMDSPSLEAADLIGIPLVFAGWLRYLLAVDDEGNAFTLSPDPLLETLCPAIKERQWEKILKDRLIWGVDLYEASLAEKVIGYFEKMTEGPGAVRKLLKESL